MLENTVSPNHPPYTKEPRVCLPDKFGRDSKTFPRIHQPARAGFPTTIRSVQHRSKDDRDSWYSFDRETPWLGKSLPRKAAPSTNTILSAWPRFKKNSELPLAKSTKPNLQNSNFAPLGREINLALPVASFHQLTADLDWNDSALRASFTLDSATKSRTPWSI
ncbi:hypothetical protein BASA81_013648 [Batrachochytrium salamandrivorans]|nr:hypothetical protein BASA81_013648 [Batrachochytrium salamandrivorans]